VRVWRVCSRRHAAFDGEGARRHGGRWNHAGAAIVYTSGSLALAALECLVNLEVDLVPEDLAAIPADIPDGFPIRTVSSRDLPRTWRRYPAPEALQDLGAAWAAAGAAAVLAVPSAIVPQERNYLLNPRHPDFRRIRVGKSETFAFDSRLWK
jgi:RES domain-containing protein